MNIAITGVTGQLGRMVVNKLKARQPGAYIVGLARKPAKAAGLGVEVRQAGYEQPQALEVALAGIDTLLLISSSEVGQRVAQHRNVVVAAKNAGVKRIVYTSLLHADVSPLSLADEHRVTEADIKASGMAYTILRNGWYTENYTGSIANALAGGAVFGSAGAGRISSASRTDYADAAVAVLSSDGHANRTYELAGDQAWTLGDLAAEISRQSGVVIPYQNLPKAQYAAALASMGLQEDFAKAIAGWDAAAGEGALFDDGRELSRLIDRPTTTLALSVASELAKRVRPSSDAPADVRVRYRTASVDGIEIFYREAGPAQAPAILLLHGFPSSSQMFRELIPRLADRYRLIAPDYPAFGHSAVPNRAKFAYTFDNFARIIGRLTEQIGLGAYALYMMDFGAPVGFRMATSHPERVTALIVQNGNAYEEGLSSSLDAMQAYWKTGKSPERDVVRGMLSAEATKAQYTGGVKDPSLLNPDAWTLDQALLDRPGIDDIQLELCYDYRNNPPLYPHWQQYLRTHKPPTLVVWGKNDDIFIAPGGAAYQRDLPEAEIHMLDTGHFVLETHGDEVARLMGEFLGRKLGKPGQA